MQLRKSGKEYILSFNRSNERIVFKERFEDYEIVGGELSLPSLETKLKSKKILFLREEVNTPTGVEVQIQPDEETFMKIRFGEKVIDYLRKYGTTRIPISEKESLRIEYPLSLRY